MELKCLIVEDEPLAAEVLSDYIRQIPFLSLAGNCTNAVMALDFMKKNAIDVLFLDLHLPGIKGFDLLGTLSQIPQVIITTAYHQYALQGYEWQVVDYLVKPIEFSRFLAAVNKLSANEKSAGSNQSNSAKQQRPYIFVYADKKQVKILLNEILFVESERDYLKIVTKEKNVVIRETMQEFEKQLPSNFFVRIHRSFLVNVHHIDAFDFSHVEVAKKSLPIGRQYKDEVLRKIQWTEI